MRLMIEFTNLKRLNIIVINQCLVKALTNSYLGGTLLVDTGLGRPVTQEIRKIENGYPWLSMIQSGLNYHIPNRRVSKM